MLTTLFLLLTPSFYILFVADYFALAIFRQLRVSADLRPAVYGHLAVPVHHLPADPDRWREGSQDQGRTETDGPPRFSVLVRWLMVERAYH